MESTAYLEEALATAAQHEPTVRAWAYLDPDRARLEARSAQQGILSGVTFAAKDVFDTADMPTEYGSPIYRGHRPQSDAAVVAQLRAAGAVCLGKSVTAEFAATHPGPTTNPHRRTHTPGGSSMGSAAAVATRSVSLAIGTQTAGSVLRPASFCGVFGFKATYGSVSVAGVKLHAPSLDTVGWFARSSDLLAQALHVLANRPPIGQLAPRNLSIAFIRGEDWQNADPDCCDVVEEAARRLTESGANVIEVDEPPLLAGLSTEQFVIQQFEAARAFFFEYEHYWDDLSHELRTAIAAGLEIDPRRYDEARRRVTTARAAEAELFGSADAILTPVALGEAPMGLGSTGDPLFCRPFTALGTPTLSVPGLRGATGLPIGVQLVGPSGEDARLIAIGGALGHLLDPDTP